MEAGKKWADLPSAGKRQQQYDRWLSPGIEFINPEAEKSRKMRARKPIDPFKVEKPDRAPVSLPVKEYGRKLIELCAPGGGFISAGRDPRGFGRSAGPACHDASREGVRQILGIPQGIFKAYNHMN